MLSDLTASVWRLDYLDTALRKEMQIRAYEQKSEGQRRDSTRLTSSGVAEATAGLVSLQRLAGNVSVSRLIADSLRVQRDDVVDGGGDGAGTAQSSSNLVKDIPFVKFTGDPKVLTPNLKAGQDFFANYEVLNMGTAPTTKDDQVWGSVAMFGTVIDQAHRNLDSPPVAANGGSYQGVVHVPGSKMAAGDWELIVTVSNASGQNSDEARVPFKVSPGDADAAAGAASPPDGGS